MFSFVQDEYIFENLIDPDQHYTFPLELERYYKKDRRTLLNLLSKKTGSSTERAPSSPRYLPSQYLFGSSLADELAVFDFTSAAVSQQQNDGDRPALIEGSSEAEPSEFIEMEIDELNLHPCMIPLVCLLKHMESNGISSSTSSEMPPWMICLYKRFHDPAVHLNIKLFLMRLLTHTHRLFRPYARYWLTPILQLCNQIFEKCSEGLNTFLIDTLVIALSWHSVAIPSELDSLSVQRLLESLFLHCKHPNSQVTRSNLDLIKQLSEAWKERIRAPTSILCKLISDPDIKSKQNGIGLSLLGILLANDILPSFPTQELPEEKFNETLLKNMKNTHRSIFAAAAEVVGMLLDVKQRQGQSNERLLEQLAFLLKWHSGQNVPDTYVTCIYALQKHYPALVEKTVMNKLSFALKKLYGDFKMECLEAMIPNITEFELIYLELRASGILDILIHKDFSIRAVALRLLFKLLPKLTVEQLMEIAQTLSVDGPNECQSWTLEIYKWMYDYIRESLTSESRAGFPPPLPESFVHLVREQLLQFFSSPNEYIRVNCRNFWCDPKRLSISSHHRLIALVDQLYSRKSEQHYLNYCTNFLLERTSHTPDYNRPLFEHPLDQCTFQEFPLPCHWRQRHHTYTTPLFTLQSQAVTETSNPVQFMQTLTDRTEMLLQTQELSARQQFQPTQTTNYNWLKQTDTFETTNTFLLHTQTKRSSLMVDLEKTKKDGGNTSPDEQEEIFRLKATLPQGLRQTAQLFRSSAEREEGERERLPPGNQTEARQPSGEVPELPDRRAPRHSDPLQRHHHSSPGTRSTRHSHRSSSLRVTVHVDVDSAGRTVTHGRVLRVASDH